MAAVLEKNNKGGLFFHIATKYEDGSLFQDIRQLPPLKHKSKKFFRSSEVFPYFLK